MAQTDGVRRCEEWESVAQELGVVVQRILEEFADMCRRSGHDEEAEAALTRLNSLLGAPVGQ